MCKDGGVILLVEDNMIEARLTINALKRSGVHAEVKHVADGKTAIELLTRTGRYYDCTSPLPALVLCDIQLPDVNGIDVVKQVRDKDTKTPIVMFTSSAIKEDIENSYACGANSYITKPIDLTETMRVLCALCQYWLTLNHAT